MSGEAEAGGQKMVPISIDQLNLNELSNIQQQVDKVLLSLSLSERQKTLDSFSRRKKAFL